MPLFPAPLPAPQIISSEPSSLTGSSNTISTNVVYLYAFELFASTTITAMRYRSGSVANGANKVSMAIYTAAGAIVSGSDTGAITNTTASHLYTSTYGTAVVLSPGQYFLAWACDNNTTSTDTFQAPGPLDSGSSRYRKATNALASGSMPLTTGAISNTILGSTPGMSALVSGGLT